MIKEFKDEYYFLSNYYPCKVIYNNMRYMNNEAAFHAQKDPNRVIEFIFLNPSNAKKLGRQVQLREDWEEVKDNIMYEINKAKFTQHKDLADKLLATGNQILIEGNTWKDTYWGMYNGYGKNKLGEILMRIREELKNGAY